MIVGILKIEQRAGKVWCEGEFRVSPPVTPLERKAADQIAAAVMEAGRKVAEQTNCGPSFVGTIVEHDVPKPSAAEGQ